MNERDFARQKRAVWEELAGLLEKASGRRGLRALSRREAQAFGPLYRRVSSDLAYARARAISDDLVVHLNALVGRAHALLYETERPANSSGAVAQFYFVEFPTLLQRHVRYFLAAFALTLLGGLYANWLTLKEPAKMSLFLPKGAGFEESIEAWKSGKMEQPPLVESASFYFTHNFRVGMVAFASGFLLGIPTADMMFANGAMIGALSALLTQHQKNHTLWPGILPHGIAELTAVFICGAAGFLIGMALLLPGPYTRLDALKWNGLIAVKLVLGTIPLFLFAGIIEGMFSRMPGISAAWRYAFAAVNGVVWYLYLFLPRPPQTDS